MFPLWLNRRLLYCRTLVVLFLAIILLVIPLCLLSPRFCVKPTFLFPCLVHICGFVICLVISCGVSFQLVPCSGPCLSPQSVWFHCALFWQLDKHRDMTEETRLCFPLHHVCCFLCLDCHLLSSLVLCVWVVVRFCSAMFPRCFHSSLISIFKSSVFFWGPYMVLCVSPPHCFLIPIGLLYYLRSGSNMDSLSVLLVSPVSCMLLFLNLPHSVT